MTIQFGNTPLAMNVNLVAGGDFNMTLTNSDGPWSATASIQLRMDGTVWAATIVGAVATIAADKVAVDALIASKPREATLFYLDGAVDLCWFKGTVTRT